MSKTIQLRNVPEDLHRVLKARAALSGQSLSEYLIGQVRRLAAKPTPEEMRERLNGREPVAASESATAALRAVRDRE